MKNNKLIYALWGVVLVTYLALFFINWSTNISRFGFSFLEFIFSFLIVSAVIILPVLLALSNMKRKNLVGFGIPILASLIILGLFIYASTCTSKMCELGPFLFIMFLTPPTLLFTCFYLLGKMAKKRLHISIHPLSFIFPLPGPFVDRSITQILELLTTERSNLNFYYDKNYTIIF